MPRGERRGKRIGTPCALVGGVLESARAGQSSGCFVDIVNLQPTGTTSASPLVRRKTWLIEFARPADVDEIAYDKVTARAYDRSYVGSRAGLDKTLDKFGSVQVKTCETRAKAHSSVAAAVDWLSTPTTSDRALQLSRLLSRFTLALAHRLSYAPGAEQTAPVLSPHGSLCLMQQGYGKPTAPGIADDD